MELSPPGRGVLSLDSIRASSIRDRKIPSGDPNRLGVVIGAAYLAGANQLEEIQQSLRIETTCKRSSKIIYPPSCIGMG